MPTSPHTLPSDEVPPSSPGAAQPDPTGAARGDGQFELLAAIRAWVAADRMNIGLDTHSGQNAYDLLKAARHRLYALAAREW